MKMIDTKDVEAFFPFLRGKLGHLWAEFIMRICSIDKINDIYNHSRCYKGAEFASRLLNDMGVKYVVGNAGRLSDLPEGAFITISNHPYGGLDGIILVDLLARIRPDFRLMVNSVISLVKTMNENFISVNPTGNKKVGVTRTNLRAVRETIRHLEDGHPVGFFPSGAVSDFSLKDFRIRDRQWQTSILHLIHSVKVPVLPVRFFDANSPFFYYLGMINWKIRSLRMPIELFNKQKQKPRIGIGNIISVKEQEQFKDAESLGIFLRNSVYEMPEPESYIPGTFLNIDKKIHEIIPA